jgi:hypothetical protein
MVLPPCLKGVNKINAFIFIDLLPSVCKGSGKWEVDMAEIIVELRGFTLRCDGQSVDVNGPTPDSCSEVALSFNRIMKTKRGSDILGQYLVWRQKLIEEMQVPIVGSSFPALDHLTDWLREHQDLVFAIENALAEHGYQKLP